MEAVSLNVEARNATGKGSARKLRKAGSIPGVVYRSGAEAVHISIIPSEIEAVFRQTNNRNTLLNVDAGGRVRTCIVRAVQRHPLSKEIRHVDLYEVDPNEDVPVSVNLVPDGVSMGVKAGGKLQLLRREIKLTCKPGDIPAGVSVNVTDLDIAAFIRLSALTAPTGCTFAEKGDFNVVTVIGKKVVVVAPTEDDGKKKKKK
jgi:large subunit ribosomal protein L25